MANLVCASAAVGSAVAGRWAQGAKGRCQQAADAARRSGLGRLARTAANRADHGCKYVRALGTHLADAAAAPGLARLVGRMRDASPMALSSFLTELAKRDPVFLSTYTAGSCAFANIETPLLLWLGVSPSVAAAVRLAGWPLDTAVVAWRVHRKSGEASLCGTLRKLRLEYAEHVRQRRSENRRFWMERAAKLPPPSL